MQCVNAVTGDRRNGALPQIGDIWLPSDSFTALPKYRISRTRRRGLAVWPR